MEVCYDAERMTLSCAQLSTTLGSNESDMLLALIAGITDKEAIISQGWGGRGLVVSDSSYYKTVHALRSKLVDVGVPRDSLKTLPKDAPINLSCSRGKLQFSRHPQRHWTKSDRKIMYGELFRPVLRVKREPHPYP